MKLLTPFLTVLRVNQADGSILHADLRHEAPGSFDLVVPAPDAPGDPVPVPGLPGVFMARGNRPPLVRLVREGACLWVTEEAPVAVMRVGEFDLLAVSDAELARLRALACQAWRVADGEPRREIIFLPAGDFRLDAGDMMVDLTVGMPRAAAAPGGVEVTGDRGETLVVHPCGPRRCEILMRRAPAYTRPRLTEDEAEFRAIPERMFGIGGEEETLALPLTVSASDREWISRKSNRFFDQHVGRHRFRPYMVRQNAKFVLLARHVEGMVFDDHGVANEPGYLASLGTGRPGRHLPLPPFMRQDGDRLFVDRGALRAMPSLPGPHVVFYNGNLSNYTHWLIDGMLQLFVMLPFLPAEARLLMPATLRGLRAGLPRVCDHYDIMNLMGFGGLKSVEIEAPYCRVEEVYWLENGGIHNMPAALIQDFRAYTASLRPGPARHDRRLYIARRGTRRVTNAAEIEAFLLSRRFTKHYLEDLSAGEQMDLFAQAEWVVAPHGAELGNLLFCRPGTKVLELAPDDEFRHYFSYMCNKLALVHGVLPCTTDDRGFFGDMTIDMERFMALFRLLKCIL